MPYFSYMVSGIVFLNLVLFTFVENDKTNDNENISKYKESVVVKWEKPKENDGGFAEYSLIFGVSFVSDFLSVVRNTAFDKRVYCIVI